MLNVMIEFIKNFNTYLCNLYSSKVQKIKTNLSNFKVNKKIQNIDKTKKMKRGRFQYK